MSALSRVDSQAVSMEDRAFGCKETSTFVTEDYHGPLDRVLILGCSSLVLLTPFDIVCRVSLATPSALNGSWGAVLTGWSGIGRLSYEAVLGHDYPHQLSGGQKQRMTLILTMLNRPELLILDEPTNALDELTREKVVTYLDQWMEESHASVILLTHDLGMGSLRGGRSVVLYRGEIIEEIPEHGLEGPLHPYTLGLMKAAVRLEDAPLSRHAIPGHALPLSRSSQGCGFLERCPCKQERCRRESPRLESRGECKIRCFIE